MSNIITVDAQDKIEEYNNRIKQGKAIVLYYAEWCGACKAMKDAWKDFLKYVKTNKSKYPNIIVASVESSYIEKVECEHGSINGFPTILYLENGKRKGEYSGERTETGFIRYLDSIKEDVMRGDGGQGNGGRGRVRGKTIRKKGRTNRRTRTRTRTPHRRTYNKTIRKTRQKINRRHKTSQRIYKI